MLSENCSTSSMYNVLNHEAEISVGEYIRIPTQLWNLKNNLNETKKVTTMEKMIAMKLEQVKNFIRNVTILPQCRVEQGKNFIRNVTILPQCCVIFACTENFLEGAVSIVSIQVFNSKVFSHQYQTKQYILGDIYETQKKEFLQFGLADAVDASDFNVKLESVKSVWDNIVQGFHLRFVRKRAPIF